VLGCAVSLGVALELAGIGVKRRWVGRAAFLGVATGIVFGFTAALVAGMTVAYGADGFGGVFTAWQTYTLLVIGPSGFSCCRPRCVRAGWSCRNRVLR
jgi:hypothetical protein